VDEFVPGYEASFKKTIDALHMLDVLKLDEENKMTKAGEEKYVWYYSIADNFDQTTLLTMAGVSLPVKKTIFPHAS
jgi:hypothetical protein